MVPVPESSVGVLLTIRALTKGISTERNSLARENWNGHQIMIIRAHLFKKRPEGRWLQTELSWEKKRAATVAAAETKARVWGVWVVGADHSTWKHTRFRRGQSGGQRGGYVASNSQCVIPTPKTFWPKSQDLNSLQLDSCAQNYVKYIHICDPYENKSYKCYQASNNSSKILSRPVKLWDFSCIIKIGFLVLFQREMINVIYKMGTHYITLEIMSNAVILGSCLFVL